MRATSRCRNWAACSAATGRARPPWPNTASACRPAPTTGRSNSRNGIRCAARRCLSRRPRAGGVFVEQIVRPTGLVDPPCIIRPTENQVDDLMAECRETALRGHRVLVTTLTKKMAEALTEYLHEAGDRKST